MPYVPSTSLLRAPSLELLSADNLGFVGYRVTTLA